VVNRSARHMFAQIVDDTAGRTLAAASTLDPAIRTAEGDKTAKARIIALVPEGVVVPDTGKMQKYLEFLEMKERFGD